MSSESIKMKLIDNHAHLDFPHFEEDRERIIERCRKELKAVINPGSAVENNRAALELAEDHPDFIYPCAGAHPTKIEGIGKEGLEDIIETIRGNKDKLVAVGEIGLDYYHAQEKGKRERQEEFFIPLLELAEELRLPAVIHSRDAEKRALEILDNYDLSEVVMHCFNGNIDTVKESLDRGYWISVSTQILYSDRVEEIVEETPVEKMLLETDSPFLAPGDEINKPLNVHRSLKKIAEVKEEDKREIGEQINRNTGEAYLTEF